MVPHLATICEIKEKKGTIKASFDFNGKMLFLYFRFTIAKYYWFMLGRNHLYSIYHKKNVFARSKSSFIFASTTAGSLCKECNLVSSAYLVNLLSLIAYTRLFIKLLNNRGPKIQWIDKSLKRTSHILWATTLSPVYTQGNFPWTGNFSLSCELPCATNGFKTKEIFLSEENFPVCKRALIHIVRYALYSKEFSFKILKIAVIKNRAVSEGNYTHLNPVRLWNAVYKTKRRMVWYLTETWRVSTFGKSQ